MPRAARFLPRAGTSISTAAVALAFPQVAWWPLIWVALVPWFFSLRRCRTLPQALVQGFWLNFLLGFAGAFWVAYAAPRYLQLPAWTGILFLMAHASIHQLQLVVFAGVYWGVARARPPMRFLELVTWALLYTGFDWITPKLFGDTLGMALHASPVFRQLAAIGGAPLLTFAVLVVNLGVYAVLWEAARGARERRAFLSRAARPALWTVSTSVVLFALGAGQGARTTQALKSSHRTVRVGIVQGSVDEELKRKWVLGDSAAARQSLRVYVEGTQKLLSSAHRPELVVWPETAYPGVFRKPESDAQLVLNAAFDRFMADTGVAFAFGAYDRDDRQDRRVLQNGLYFVTPAKDQRRDQLSPMHVYHKAVLFPLGEYFPLLREDTVRRWLPHSAHFAPGKGPHVLSIELGGGERRLRIGPLICYEDVFPGPAADLADQGAQMLVNISNDSWFGDYGLARMHLMMAKLRSVETGLSQVRVANSGYSGLILPHGEVQSRLDFGVEAARTVDVPLLDSAPTVRVRLGDWFGPLSLGLGIILLLAALRRRRGAGFSSPPR
ncbi:MAG: apolipoprotein N-acyltransferase [Myxococcales bacterium]|jgi:apolipoprotein N-acyltransferase